MYRYRAKLVKVVDADTVDVSVDLGFNVWFSTRLRLWGINAPERFTDEGKAASSWLSDYLAAHTSFEISTYKDVQEKYGRFLATIWLPPAVNVNEELVKAGHAVKYMDK